MKINEEILTERRKGNPEEVCPALRYRHAWGGGLESSTVINSIVNQVGQMMMQQNSYAMARKKRKRS
jgi:hypothetical protein